MNLERQLQLHARSVRNLATALLGDADAGQDVAQQTLLIARQKAPASTRSLRAWMLRVGRRLASRWRRSEQRRLRREQIAARPERQPSAADDAQRAELLQSIANAVAALPAPSREVVLLRHFDELPPRAIAVQLSLSVEAVESRLRRAHAQLREQLQQHRPVDWRAALLLFAAPGAWAPLPGAIAVSAKSKSLIAAAALSLLCCAWLLWSRSPADARPVESPEMIAADHGAAPPSPTAPPTHRTELAAATASDASQQALTWSAMLTGRVVDEHRRPVEDAVVVAQAAHGERVEGRSGADGRFQLAVPVARAWTCSGEVTATRDGRTAVASFWGGVTTSTQQDVGVLALLAAGDLQVLACCGNDALAQAKITAVRCSSAPGRRHEQSSDARGMATLAVLSPGHYCVTAEATDGRWILGEVDVIAHRTATLTLDLLSSTPIDVEVRARSDGRPIADAVLDVLFVGGDSYLLTRVPLDLLVSMPRTDASGQARLVGLRRGTGVGIGARHPGWRPTVVDVAYRTDWNATAPHAEVLLDDLASATWKLVDGEVPVPADGTLFTLFSALVPLRDGCLRLPERAPSGGGWTTLAFGPDCYAELTPTADGTAPPPVPLRRSRSLTVELRGPAGEPLAGWPLLCFCNGTHLVVHLRTDAAGRAVTEALPAASVTVQFDGLGGTIWRVGTVDLTKGDASLPVQLGRARHVRAHVFVDGVPGLPGNLQLRADMARVEDVVEDVEHGTLEFEVRQCETGKDCGLLLQGSVDQSVARAELPPGMEPAEVEFQLRSRSTGVLEIDITPPLQSSTQLRVERYLAQHGSGSPAPQAADGQWVPFKALGTTAAQTLQHVDPGRYRLHDELSEVIGPEVTVTTDGSDAKLTLDLSKVVPVSGRVVATPPFTGITIEVRDAAGTTRARRRPADDGTFALPVNVDRAGLQLVAVRGATTSPPMPVIGAMSHVQLLLRD